jgi:hypothetical protein
MKLLQIITFVFITTALSAPSFALSTARRGISLSGEHSLSFGVGLVTASQDDINGVIDAGNNNGTGGHVKSLGSGYEFFAQYGIRFDNSMFGFVLRPSMINQSTSGDCQGSHCKYEVDGLAIFPMLRMIPLENDFIKLFFQLGLGYGQMNGEITQGSNSVKFKGSAFGAMGGLGVDFCITQSDCISVEGDLRYLPIDRNLVTSGSNSGIQGLSGGAGHGDELEANNLDVGTTMSGLLGFVSYTMIF